MGTDDGPPQLPAVASVRELGAKAMPPLWQYLSLVSKEKADEPIAAPKGPGSRTLPGFPLETGLSRGRAQGP